MLESRPRTAGMLLTVSMAAALLVAAQHVAAHHSFAGYEAEGQIRLSGTVTHFQWTNPHVYIGLDAADGNGATAHWLIECANPGILNRAGWKWNMIGVGDEITVIVSPLINGDAGALLKGVRLADGSTFSNDGPAGPAKIPFDE